MKRELMIKDLPPFQSGNEVRCVPGFEMDYYINSTKNERITHGQSYTVEKVWYTQVFKYWCVVVVGMSTHWDAVCFEKIMEETEKICVN
jgi:hypothetical protein